MWGGRPRPRWTPWSSRSSTNTGRRGRRPRTWGSAPPCTRTVQNFWRSILRFEIPTAASAVPIEGPHLPAWIREPPFGGPGVEREFDHRSAIAIDRGQQKTPVLALGTRVDVY